MAPLLLPTHAFGVRYGLPLPLAGFVVGGALVVVASFVLVRLGVGAAGPASRGTAGPAGTDVPPRLARTNPGLGLAGVLVLALLAACGLAGSNTVPENLLPTAFWLVAWIVIPISCGLVGDWTRHVNPFAVLARLADHAGVRRALLGRAEPLTLPARVGWWPAVVLFLLLTLGELVYNLTATLPHVIATGLIVYALVDAAMGLLVGAAWLDRGEVFSVLFATWGRLGVWRFGAAGRRGPGGGLDVPFERTASRVVFVLLLLVGVTFDGITATPRWSRAERGLSQPAVENLRDVGLVVVAVSVGVVFAMFATASWRAAGARLGPRDSLVRLLPSLLPIALGYVIAHNAQYVLVNLQLLGPLIGNPLGTQAGNLHLPYPFNDSFEPNATFLPSAFYWYVGIAAIVGAHVIAVVVAHRHLIAGATERGARRGEYPWLVAMVAYTAFSLVLIAQPLVQDTATAVTQPVAGGVPRA